jgi:hypothetical protein
MWLYLGAGLFGLVFVLISPASRAFLMASIAAASNWMTAWAPVSFILVSVAIAAPLIAIHLIRSWPVHVEPENPMAKYRRDPLDDID